MQLCKIFIASSLFQAEMKYLITIAISPFGTFINTSPDIICRAFATPCFSLISKGRFRYIRHIKQNSLTPKPFDNTGNQSSLSAANIHNRIKAAEIVSIPKCINSIICQENHGKYLYKYRCFLRSVTRQLGELQTVNSVVRRKVRVSL